MVKHVPRVVSKLERNVPTCGTVMTEYMEERLLALNRSAVYSSNTEQYIDDNPTRRFGKSVRQESSVNGGCAGRKSCLDGKPYRLHLLVILAIRSFLVYFSQAY